MLGAAPLHPLRFGVGQKKLNTLRRYTQLPQLFSILTEKAFKMTDASRWDDVNDREIIERYREARGLKRVQALCFTMGQEAYHHWRIYAHGISGCCLEFDREQLAQSIARVRELRQRTAIYLSKSEADAYVHSEDLWPFLKRSEYSDEKEYRVIYDDSVGVNFFILGFHMHALKRVVLNPFLDRDMVSSLMKTIHRIPECENLTITQTRILEDPDWAAFTTKPD